MGERLVSVVIPTHNYENFVVGAVESVLAQSYPHREIIVVDDGSTDNTRERLAPYEGRIRYLYQANSGPAAARNAGIREARGSLIAFLDSDDLWHPEKLAVQLRYLEEHPEVALLATDHQVFLGSDSGPINWPSIDASCQVTARPISFEELVVGARFGPCSVIMRKWCFDEIGLFDEGLRGPEDLDMWIRIARHLPVVKLDSPLWLYRIHGGNAHCGVSRMAANTRKMIAKIFDGPEPLSVSPWLKRKALANFSINLAYGYRDSHVYGAAMAGIIRSFLFWPFPDAYMNIKHLHPLARLKFLAVVASQAASWYLGMAR